MQSDSSFTPSLTQPTVTWVWGGLHTAPRLHVTAPPPPLPFRPNPAPYVSGRRPSARHTGWRQGHTRRFRPAPFLCGDVRRPLLLCDVLRFVHSDSSLRTDPVLPEDRGSRAPQWGRASGAATKHGAACPSGELFQTLRQVWRKGQTENEHSQTDARPLPARGSPGTAYGAVARTPEREARAPRQLLKVTLETSQSP